MAITYVRLVTFLHPRFWFLLCSSSWLKTLFAQRTSHASSPHSTQTEISNFPVNHILQVSCDWILCCDWYALQGVGRQTALWPCPRPFPSVQNRVWPRNTSPAIFLFPGPAQLFVACSMSHVSMTQSTNGKRIQNEKAKFHVLFNELWVQCLVCITVVPH